MPPQKLMNSFHTLDIVMTRHAGCQATALSQLLCRLADMPL